MKTISLFNFAPRLSLYLLFSVCGLLFQSANQVFSQNVVIPDTAFLYALIEVGVDANGDSLITYEEAKEITYLYVSEKNISDLTGIEAFVNLTSLNCSHNKLSSLDVSNNIHLSQGASDGFSRLGLDCSYNQLSSLDVSNNTELISLACNNNMLSSLDVSNNIHLSLGHEVFSTLPGLNCSNNQLSNLDVSACTELSYLSCNNNQLSSLDVSHNTALVTLHCSDNQLSSLDVSKNIHLQRRSTDKYYGYANGLNCSNNQLSSLDISNNLSLSRIYCSGNQITELDFSKNLELIAIYCADNQLTNLDVTKNLRLKSLDCSNNQLSTLDISNNNNLGSGGNYFYGSVLYLSDMPGLYQVCVWNTFNEDSLIVNTEGSSNINFTSECATAIESKQIKGLSVYPNPTTNLLNIETENSACSSVEIHSLNGQMIYQEEMEGYSKQIDLTTLTNGIYFLTVRSKDRVLTERVVKF